MVSIKLIDIIMDDQSIWTPYERNSYHYHKCADVTICPNKYNEKCCCKSDALVHPTMVADCGYIDAKPSMKKKCYIGFGEICSICIEPILSKRTAWLTHCGHSFHHKCLIENYQYRYENCMFIDEYSDMVPCPVCREGLVGCCVGFDVLDRYNSSNGLDQLENFWLKMDIMPYQVCWKCNTAVGTNKSCKICISYRVDGSSL